MAAIIPPLTMSNPVEGSGVATGVLMVPVKPSPAVHSLAVLVPALQLLPVLQMRYQVTFRKRFNQQGGGSDSPQTLLNLPDGVVQEGIMVEQIQPDSVHEETMDEDDDILPFGSEIWEYEVTDGREKEFELALEESGVVIEYDPIDEETE